MDTVLFSFNRLATTWMLS